MSAAIQRKGIPRRLLDYSREHLLEVVVSPETLIELSVVLRRSHIVRRYNITEIDADEFVSNLSAYALSAPSILELNAVPDDPSDNHVIGAAIETECNYIVTGDVHLLSMGSFGSVQIVSPRQLLDHIASNDPEILGL